MGKIEELLINKGLYDNVDITIDDYDEIRIFLSGYENPQNTVDCFCIHCRTNRIFKSVKSEIHNDTGSYTMSNPARFNSSQQPNKDGLYNSYLNKRYVLKYVCTRDMQHSLLFDLIITNDKIIKIGQYPSIADLIKPSILKYKSVLDKQFQEFSKALGLYAHGVGIGSFVYLRRIIEKLVLDNYDKYSAELNVRLEEFEHMNFCEKIDVLKDRLPSVLVKNRNLYGIMSKGLHELSEEECLSMFPFVKTGIEMILDDLLTEQDRSEKERILSKFVAQKTGELRQK
jgi:hypothetical protein